MMMSLTMYIIRMDFRSMAIFRWWSPLSIKMSIRLKSLWWRLIHQALVVEAWCRHF